MYAVVKTGGKQYRVAEGQRLDIERVPGETVTFEPVLVVDGSDVRSIRSPNGPLWNPPGMAVR